eukprot:4169824-Pyramimonas_sp.AAC.1
MKQKSLAANQGIHACFFPQLYFLLLWSNAVLNIWTWPFATQVALSTSPFARGPQTGLTSSPRLGSRAALTAVLSAVMGDPP